jgi:hypothetical protein
MLVSQQVKNGTGGCHSESVPVKGVALAFRPKSFESENGLGVSGLEELDQESDSSSD